jgi:hypothetical protein
MARKSRQQVLRPLEHEVPAQMREDDQMGHGSSGCRPDRNALPELPGKAR